MLVAALQSSEGGWEEEDGDKVFVPRHKDMPHYERLALNIFLWLVGSTGRSDGGATTFQARYAG